MAGVVDKVREARRRAAANVVQKVIDRVYKEVANLDGDQEGLMNVSELYVGVLLVFNDLNKFVPGGHINPPKRRRVVELLKKFDKDANGKLDRQEFEDLIRLCMPGLVRRIITHVLIYCSVVPIMVWVVKKGVSEIPHCRKFGQGIPGGLLAAIFTIAFKISGVLRN